MEKGGVHRPPVCCEAMPFTMVWTFCLLLHRAAAAVEVLCYDGILLTFLPGVPGVAGTAARLTALPANA